MSKYVNGKYEFLHNFIRWVEREGYAETVSHLDDGSRQEIRRYYENCIREMKHSVRQDIKKFYELNPDQLAHPLTEAWRHGGDGESGWDYIIIPDNGQSNVEIEEFIETEVGYPPIISPYDCTGKRFTWCKTWRRTPVGIAVTHHWSVDI